MTKEREALKALIHEMEYVLSCINAEEIPFDGDDFHEALRLGKEALDHLAQPKQEKERCVGCEACIDTACGRDECPKGWPKAAQLEQEPVAIMREMLEVQGQHGNWNYDPYMHGLYNGMEYMVALAEKREPKFRDAPKTWSAKYEVKRDNFNNAQPIEESTGIKE